MPECKQTSHTTIMLTVIRELRLERGFHQAHLAEACGKSPSAWTKIETGKSPLTMEVFLRVSRYLMVPASFILAAAERYTAWFQQNGWAVLTAPLDSPEDVDHLLIASSEYYNSPGFKNRNIIAHSNPTTSILTGPIYNTNGTMGTVTVAPVFLFAVVPEFRKQQCLTQ